MEGLLNVGSLVLGLIAWGLPIISIVKYRKKGFEKGFILSFLSMVSCTISLLFQIFYNHHLVKIRDWSALMDTTGVLLVVSTILLVITIVLNGVYLVVSRSVFYRRGGN